MPTHPATMPVVGLNRSIGSRPLTAAGDRSTHRLCLAPGRSRAVGARTYAAVMSAGTVDTSDRLAEVTASDASLRRFLHGLPGVDQVGAEARAAGLATRSIKTTAKAWAIDMSIRMVDLTTLEGADTPGKVRSLCAKAMRPDPTDPAAPPVAAICVYPDLVETAVTALRGSAVQIASVATAFPSGRAALSTKLHDVRDAVAAG